MSARIGYLRVSSEGQSLEAQRTALGGGFDKEFSDEGVSGSVPAANRPAFGELLKFVREGDTVFVYAVDRLGRDAIDVQTTVRDLLKKGVSVHVHGLGLVGPGVGELILAVLAQIADMERGRIKERCESGRAAARASLIAIGKTHKGKISLGRPFAADVDAVKAWRAEHNASISKTAENFGLSIATVKRYGSARPRLKDKKTATQAVGHESSPSEFLQNSVSLNDGIQPDDGSHLNVDGVPFVQAIVCKSLINQ